MQIIYSFGPVAGSEHGVVGITTVQYQKRFLLHCNIYFASATKIGLGDIA